MFRRSRARQIESIVRECSNSLEGASVTLPIEEIRVREIRRIPKASIEQGHHRQPIRLVVRQWVQYDAFQHAEDRDVCTDT